VIGRGAIAAAVLAVALAAAAPALGAGDPLRSQQYGLSMVESDAAHLTATGAGATVAIVDTGVLATHPDLRGGRLVPGYDFVDNDALPQDGNGHGSHVTGIVGATAGNGVGVSSVAPGARLMPIRVLDDDGSGSSDDVAKGIDYAVAHGADVINLSLGGDLPDIFTPIFGEDAFGAAIDHALDAGRIVVAASGNNGLPACSQPSGSGRLLCVGSVGPSGTRSSFSNFGSGLGIMGPGEDVISTYNNGGYERISGTSQATPHVAGVAALLVGKGIRGQAAVNRILATARDAGPAGPDPQYGAGIVNARRAVAGLSSPGGGKAIKGTGSAARISMARRAKIRTVLKRGIRVRCRAAGSGRCRVKATRGKRRLAYASRRVALGRSRLVVAKVNRYGRKLLKRALRRKKRVSIRVRITLPGARPQLRRLTLRP
jgi:subtilisin family serine protease